MRRLGWLLVVLAACGGKTSGPSGTGGRGGMAGSGGGAAGHAGAAGGSAGGAGGGAAAGSGGSAGAGQGGGGAGAAGGAALDGGVACAPFDVPPDGGAFCGSSARACDPPKGDGGFCRYVPPTNAATTSFTIWVEDAAAPDGGWRVTLTGPTNVSAGGHTYQDLGEGLVGGGGNGIFGDLYVARDGQAKWTGFHLEGWPQFHGDGRWDWPAVLTVSRAGATTTATVGRHYTVTRTNCASGAGSITYLFAADEPPRACAFGVDLVAITFPGS